ncbi:hypothetical protein MRX96_008588 [Rhipicephalus microplus]
MAPERLNDVVNVDASNIRLPAEAPAMMGTDEVSTSEWSGSDPDVGRESRHDSLPPEMSRAENEGYAMCPLKESQKGPRPSFQDGKTSMNERPQKLRKLPTHEQGTDTEQEEHNKAFASASQRYQRLLKPHLVKKGLEAHIRSTEQKVDKQRNKTAALAEQLRRVQVQSQHLQNELAEAQIMSQHYKSKLQLKEDEGHILPNKIREAEEALATKLRTAKGHLKGRLERSQRALKEMEAERQASLREIRQFERLVTEKTKQAEEKRKLGRRFQESKDKIDPHIKKLQARLYSAKLEYSLEKARRMDIERQVIKALHEHARLNRELVGCSKLGSPWSVMEASNRDKHGAQPSSVAALRSALR